MCVSFFVRIGNVESVPLRMMNPKVSLVVPRLIKPNLATDDIVVNAPVVSDGTSARSFTSATSGGQHSCIIEQTKENSHEKDVHTNTSFLNLRTPAVSPHKK